MAKKKKDITLADQFADNNKKARGKWSSKNMITPHPESKKSGNGIPTLIDSTGLLKSAVDPQVLTSSSTPNIPAAVQATAATPPMTLSSGGMGESVTTSSDDETKKKFYRRFREDDESSEDTDEEVLDGMRANYDSILRRANTMFDNLNLNIEWDSSLKLIHILVRINDEITDDLPKDDNNLYPYPFDITAPQDASAVIVYNSKRSIYDPDMSTEIVDDNSQFNVSNWYDDPHGLERVVYESLRDLDNALDEYAINSGDNSDEVIEVEDESEVEESFTEADDGSEVEYPDYYASDYPNYEGYILVDTKEVPDRNGNSIKYDWIMNSDQSSLFIIDGKVDHSEEDVTNAQEWWDSYIEFSSDEDKLVESLEKMIKLEDINGAYAVIKTQSPYGAEDHVKVASRARAYQLARDLNDKVDPTEEKYIVRKMTDDNIDKYDLDRYHMKSDKETSTESLLDDLSKMIESKDI